MIRDDNPYNLASGKAFVRYISADFTFTATRTGEHWVILRYSNDGFATSRMAVTINGVRRVAALGPSAGPSWYRLDGFRGVPLIAGANQIRVAPADGSSPVNLDWVQIAVAWPTARRSIRVTAAETWPGAAGNWWVQAYAYCADAASSRGWNINIAVSETTSASQQQTAVGCDDPSRRFPHGAVRSDAVTHARAQLKPEIPLTGAYRPRGGGWRWSETLFGRGLGMEPPAWGLGREPNEGVTSGASGRSA